MRKLSMKELGRLSTDEYKDVEKLPIVVVLDNVRSGLNVGSVFRTSDAFLVEEIYLCGYTPQPPHRDVLKSALGSTDSVSWKHFESIEDGMKELKDKGYAIFAVEQADESTLLSDVNVSSREKIALIFGNEVHGVSDSIMEIADGCIEVPQWGTKHSLNISVCAGIVIWEVAKSMKLH